MEFPKFFESAATNVPRDYANDGYDDIAPDGVQPFPAPWFIDPPRPAPGDTITTIEIPAGPPQAGGPPTDVIENRDSGESGFSAKGVDAIAFYLPWHADPQGWGIYFLERPFFAFVKEMAAIAGVPAGPLAPIVLRQVLFHELTHFRFEVAGSELEDVLGRPLYLSYLRNRFGRPQAGLSGPIEESIATWSEVRFSRAILPASLRPKPASYQQAVEALASTAPLGYRDWKAAASDRKREGLVAAVASLIADQPIATGRWGGWLTEENKRSVPRRWVGDLSLLPAVGALEKSAPNVTVKAFERWLKVQGITWVPSGQGSHRKFQHDGRWQGYGTSGSSDRLYFKDAKRLAKVFRYPTVADFLIAVAAKEPLRTAVAA